LKSRFSFTNPCQRFLFLAISNTAEFSQNQRAADSLFYTIALFDDRFFLVACVRSKSFFGSNGEKIPAQNGHIFLAGKKLKRRNHGGYQTIYSSQVMAITRFTISHLASSHVLVGNTVQSRDDLQKKFASQRRSCQPAWRDHAW
jgi:hypothetical protein